MTTFRIVPVITQTSVLFKVQSKFLCFWNNKGRISSSMCGNYLEIFYFKTPQQASDWIKRRFGTSSNIINYEVS
jgi:hypothetical protein